VLHQWRRLPGPVLRRCLLPNPCASSVLSTPGCSSCRQRHQLTPRVSLIAVLRHGDCLPRLQWRTVWAVPGGGARAVLHQRRRVPRTVLRSCLCRHPWAPSVPPTLRRGGRLPGLLRRAVRVLPGGGAREVLHPRWRLTATVLRGRVLPCPQLRLPYTGTDQPARLRSGGILPWLQPRPRLHELLRHGEGLVLHRQPPREPAHVLLWRRPSHEEQCYLPGCMIPLLP